MPGRGVPVLKRIPGDEDAMGNRTKLLAVAVAAFLPWAALSAEEPACHNVSFTHFGVGVDSVTFREELEVQGKLRTRTRVTNAVQKSGGYTPMSPKTGFYLATFSTLEGGTGRETWDHPLGQLQTNAFKVETLGVSLSGAYHFFPGHHATLGVGFSSMHFTRADFHPDPALVANRPLGAVAEDINSYLAMAGYRYDSFFRNPDRRLRLIAGVQAGFPLYYNVFNTGGAQQAPDGTIETEDPVTLRGFFVRGCDVQGELGAAYRLNEHFSLSVNGEGLYTRRSEIRGDGHTLPQVTATSLKALGSLIWAF